MLAHLRAVVPTYPTTRAQGGGTEYTYGMPLIEDPSRAITQMRNLAKDMPFLKEGHTLLSMIFLSLHIWPFRRQHLKGLDSLNCL